MSLLSHIQFPSSKDDWRMLENIPDAARRLSFHGLRQLLSALTFSPVWLGEPETLSDLLDGTIYWPAEKYAQVWAIGLPEAYTILGWERKLPAGELKIRDAIHIFTTGYKNYISTSPSSRGTPGKWPEGIEPESWFSNEKTQSVAFTPVRELIMFWRNHLKAISPSLIIHGSVATLDTVPSYSDLDTLLVLSDEILSDEKLFGKFLPLIVESQKYLLAFNPAMHHGHMLICESELRELREAYVPLCLIQNGVCFGKKYDEITKADSDLENLLQLNSFKDFFERTKTHPPEIRTVFDLIWWSSNSIFIPLIYLQCIRGYSTWKREGLDDVKKYLTDQEIDLVNFLTGIRANFVEIPVSARMSFNVKLEKNRNPGAILKSVQNNATLAEDDLRSMGITNRRMHDVALMWERLHHEALKLFCKKKDLINNPIANILGLLKSDSFIEFPTAVDRESYTRVQETFLDRASREPGIHSVYGFGAIGCPGLSDIDFIAVLGSEVERIPNSLTVKSFSQIGRAQV